MKDTSHNYGARQYPKLVLNILKITWKQLPSFMHYEGLNSMKNIWKYFTLSLEISQNISKNLFGQVFNYIMNVQLMKGWKVNVHGWTPSMMMLMIMLDMMLAMMLWMSFITIANKVDQLQQINNLYKVHSIMLKW
jgi:hypothetical protein